LVISYLLPMSKLTDSTTQQFKIYSLAQSHGSTLIFTVLLSLSIFLPSFIHQQGITGPLINAFLLLAVVWLGKSAAITLGLIPSVIALSRGLLPITLAPIVPFIMLANCLFVLVFSSFYKKSFSTAVILAATSKFLFLYTVSQVLLVNLLPTKFLIPASQMFSWPQLATALAGGLIAWLVIKEFFKPSRIN